MNSILRSCSWSTTSYTADATSLVSGINVSASRPTDASQLTTTFSRGPDPTATGGSSNPTSTGGSSNDNSGGGSGSGNGDNNSGDDSNNNSGGGNGNSDNENQSSNNNDSSSNDDDNAAGILSPFYFAGAIVAGAMAFA